MEPPPTLEDLVKEVGISVNLLDQRCSDEHLNSISLFLDWRNVAPHLGLSKTDIDDIKSEERTEPGRRLAALQKWKSKYSFKATLKNLVVVLLTIGKADSAESICHLLKSQAGKHSVLVAAIPAPNTSGDCQQESSVIAAEPSGAVVETPSVPVQHSETSIENEIKDLEGQFLEVVKTAAKHLRTVELSDVKLCITQLPVSVRNQHIKFLQCSAAAIDEAQSVDAIFVILGLYWDFLNCSLLVEIVRQLGNDATKQLMEKYTEKLKQFRMKTKLGDFIGKWAHSVPPHFSQFITKLQGDWRDRTLEHLEEFRNELARSLCVEGYVMPLTNTEPGSVAVTWAIQSSLPAIADSLQSAFHLLQKKYGVLMVIFQEKCIPDLKSLESPPTATPTVSLTLPEPLETSRQETEEAFDIIRALMDAGVPHITEQILCYLDSQSLMISEAVSTLWRDVISELPIWKHLLKRQLENSPLWRGLFERRGWYKYLDVPLTKQMSGHYRQLYHTASKDIHSLKTNWTKGEYSLTTIETGSRVMCLQYDDTTIVTGHGGPEYTIKIWDRSSLQILKVLYGHKDIVYCLQYNKEMVLSGSQHGIVMVWDIQTGLMVNNLLHHEDIVFSLKLTTKVLVTGSKDFTVAVWDIKSPTDITLRTVLKNENIVCAVELSETNIISGDTNTIKVWDFTGELIRTLHGHSYLVWSLQLRGSYLTSASHDKTVRIWNVNTGECVRVLHGHDSVVKCVALDDKRILSGSSDGTVKVWDLAAALDPGSSNDTLCTATLKEHTHWVRGLQFDDFQVISCSSDKSINIYDFLNPTPPVLRIFL